MWGALLAAAVGCRAGGLREFEEGWLVPAHRLRAELDGGEGKAGAWLTAGRSRLFGMPELPLLFLGGGGRTGPWEGWVTWQRLGGGLYREDRWHLGGSRGRRWRVGLIGGRDRLALTGDPTRGRWTAACTVASPRFGPWRVDCRLPLTRPPVWHGGRVQERLARVVGTWRRCLWALVAERGGNGRPSFQAEAWLCPGIGGAGGLRFEPATGTVVLVTGWRRGDLLLRTSHAVHPALGVTHRWSLGWRTGGEGP